MGRLTELEKSIILVFLVLTRGSTGKYLKQDGIVLKFPRQQRKAVRKSLEKLVKGKLLSKHPKELGYRFTEEGLERSRKILAEGAMLPKLK